MVTRKSAETPNATPILGEDPIEKRPFVKCIKEVV